MAQESGIQTVLVPGRYRLRNQITLPYTILAVVVGVVAAFLITQVVVSSMEERFGNQLLEAGGQAADSVVRLEQRHLETWRLVAFTHGLSDAILAADHKSLSTIAGLAALNACLDAIDVMNSDGKPVFSAHRDPAAPLDCQRYSFEPWNIELGATGLVQKVAASTVDHLGDKYADLVPVDDQWILYTSGPIYSPSGDWAGSLLIGTYLDNAIRRFQADALADVTIYAADGQVLSTSFPVAEKDALAITPSIFSQVMENQGRLVLREPLEVAGDPYSQALGVFEVRSGQDMGVIGTALPVQWLLTAAVPARNWLIAVFGLAIAAILTMGNILATRIVTPIHHLVGASRRVAAGDLTPQVEAGSRDEIGTLAEVFNRMVLGLRERERVKDLFGRYMGEEIADEILKGNIEIGGRRVVATVLYSDIRDFTRLSERADPANLVASLQEYFTAMIAEIEVEQGLINKFGGDSILALFGAPVYRPDQCPTGGQVSTPDAG